MLVSQRFSQCSPRSMGDEISILRGKQSLNTQSQKILSLSNWCSTCEKWLLSSLCCNLCWFSDQKKTMVEPSPGRCGIAIRVAAPSGASAWPVFFHSAWWMDRSLADPRKITGPVCVFLLRNRWDLFGRNLNKKTTFFGWVLEYFCFFCWRVELIFKKKGGVVLSSRGLWA